MRPILLLSPLLPPLLLANCAAPPQWVKGTDRSAYYYQGVGIASSASQAERDALFDLCANIHGIEVESVMEDFLRERDKVGDRGDQYQLESDFQQWVKTYIEGKVPAEARVVERWKGQGQRWAYSIVEKPGQERPIKRLYNQALANVKHHAFVPGWAQFQKKQPRKAWTFISGASIGIIGGAAFALSSNDAGKRRDQATIRIERDHYDDLANQRFWISNAFYALAGGMYAINVLDGMNSRVEPYQLLTQVEPGGVRLVIKF